MRDIPRFAVIPTRNRPDELARCVASIMSQVDTIIIVNNSDQRLIVDLQDHAQVITRQVLDQPPNLSRLWNIGRHEARYIARNANIAAWDVAYVNDDAIIPPGWFDAVSNAMRANFPAEAASSSSYVQQVRLFHMDNGDGPSQATRVTGWAFMLRGESGLRFDERFVWWCGDDDISRQAMGNGGVVAVPGFPVENTLANTTTTGVLLEQSARDMQYFVDKWGVRPW